MAESSNPEPQKIPNPFKKPPPSINPHPLSNPAHLLSGDNVITSIEMSNNPQKKGVKPPEIPLHDSHVVSGYKEPEVAPVKPAQDIDARKTSSIASIKEKLKTVESTEETLPTAAD